VQHAIAVAHGLGKTVVLNPAPAVSLPPAVLAQVDYLVPNEIEAAMLAGGAGGASANAVALQGLGCRNVIVTLGAEGVHAAFASGSRDFPAQAVTAVDTTAAGDTFIGGFVAALAAGRDPEAAIDLGQRAAAIGVTRHGAQTSIPSLHELEQP
jgi:ribokinase